MKKEVLQSYFPEMTEADYLAQVEHWLAIKDIDQAKAYYETEILPRSCYRLRQQAPNDEVELLFVPVGTQSYAPTMVCLASPAKMTVLLATKESQKFAIEVEELFSGERVFHRIQVEEFDSSDIVAKVTAAYDVLGQPASVVCDVTGGTKVMTATLAGIAAVNGWPQVYVSSKYVSGRGSHSEQVIPVTSAFEHLGGWNRVRAYTLASSGRFGEAAKYLKLAAEQSLASAPYRAELRRFGLAQSYREGNFEKVKRGAAKLARDLRLSLPNETTAVLNSGDLHGFHYWVAHCLAAEGQALAAVGVLTRLGLTVEAREVQARLRELAKVNGEKWNLKAWKPLEDFLGRAYSKGINALG